MAATMLHVRACVCVCVQRGGSQSLRDQGRAGREGPGESRVKGVFGLRGSLGVCRGKVKVSLGVKWGGEGHRGGTHTLHM